MAGAPIRRSSNGKLVPLSTKSVIKKIELTSVEAALRHELGDSHSYDFVDGTFPSALNEDAFDDLERYVAAEGPYDGVMGFSLGATFVMSWMFKKLREQNDDKPVQLPFKVGIFFSAPGLLQYHDLLVEQLFGSKFNPADGFLDIPTAHIWGCHDRDKEKAEAASQACNELVRSVFVHDKGHEIPISSDNVILMAKAINRAITRAQT
ncbi:Serine hydrolase FSH [Penicillium italicum]|uniref:Serine hydrolase FSH n=1 Tax=Penicillium italicum TaxID=40296 RepID=A0A0A2L127_PENIT|nr:Serine hydrolase FSH [Penicillium italicum]